MRFVSVSGSASEILPGALILDPDITVTLNDFTGEGAELAQLIRFRNSGDANIFLNGLQHGRSGRVVFIHFDTDSDLAALTFTVESLASAPENRFRAPGNVFLFAPTTWQAIVYNGRLLRWEFMG